MGADVFYILKGFKNPLLGNRNYHYIELSPLIEFNALDFSKGGRDNRFCFGAGLNLGYLIGHNDDRTEYLDKSKIDIALKLNTIYYYRKVGIEVFYLHQVEPYNVFLAFQKAFQRTIGVSLLFKIK